MGNGVKLVLSVCVQSSMQEWENTFCRLMISRILWNGSTHSTMQPKSQWVCTFKMQVWMYCMHACISI